MYCTLNNGLKMPMVGLGVFRMEDSRLTADVVASALKNGYRSIDTAAIYGNEEAIGQGLKESGVPRSEIFLTTKVWNEDQRSGKIQSAFESSLTRLAVDYVDLYLIHWPVKEKYQTTWKELEKILEGGRARAIGVSNFHIHHLEDIENISGIVPAVNQVECHPYLTQKTLLEYCSKKGIRLEAWSPLGAQKNGVLEDKVITNLANKYMKSPAQIILRWDIQCGILTIPKSANLGRIKENIDIFDFELTPEEMTAIDQLNTDQRVGSDPETFTF